MLIDERRLCLCAIIDMSATACILVIHIGCERRHISCMFWHDVDAIDGIQSMS